MKERKDKDAIAFIKTIQGGKKKRNINFGAAQAIMGYLLKAW
jgi:hypothetical protein